MAALRPAPLSIVLECRAAARQRARRAVDDAAAAANLRALATRVRGVGVNARDYVETIAAKGKVFKALDLERQRSGVVGAQTYHEAVKLLALWNADALVEELLDTMRAEGVAVRDETYLTALACYARRDKSAGRFEGLLPQLPRHLRETAEVWALRILSTKQDHRGAMATAGVPVVPRCYTALIRVLPVPAAIELYRELVSDDRREDGSTTTPLHIAAYERAYLNRLADAGMLDALKAHASPDAAGGLDVGYRTKLWVIAACVAGDWDEVKQALAHADAGVADSVYIYRLVLRLLVQKAVDAHGAGDATAAGEWVDQAERWLQQSLAAGIRSLALHREAHGMYTALGMERKALALEEQMRREGMPVPGPAGEVSDGGAAPRPNHTPHLRRRHQRAEL